MYILTVNFNYPDGDEKEVKFPWEISLNLLEELIFEIVQDTKPSSWVFTVVRKEPM